MFLNTNNIGVVKYRSCPWWAWVSAAVAISYTIACIVYLIGSRFMGTPFSDSLTDHQRLLKAKSSKQRGALFVVSFFICLVVFSLCMRAFAS